MHTPNQPRSIVGPSGATVRPTIREIRVGNEIRTEAYYVDPRTGQFITKIPVSVRTVDDK